MRGNIGFLLFCVVLVFLILLMTRAIVTAQFGFYYPGSYLFSPFSYAFSPLYTSYSSFYNPFYASPYYNTGYFNPTPVAPLTFTAPTVSPAPTVTIAAATSLVPLTPITTIAGVIIADWIINTGNPQVTAVLTLIVQDPTLLDNPLLLNALINTGNPDVASALAWLSLAI